MRLVAVTSAGTMLLFGLAESAAPAVAALVVASLVTVADNGLGVTAVAEAGGDFWAGRAIGIHSTGQLVVSSMAPSGLEVVLGSFGYGAVFGAVAVLPFLAIWTLPVGSETGAAGLTRRPAKPAR